MLGDWIVGVILGVVLLFLGIETIHLRRLRSRLPLRIAVTGTRGKSSTVRLIAAGLAACGHRVTYKTTGSRPVMGLPSGEEKPIRRLGLPSPLEQRRLLRDAVKSRSTVLVAEAMSIRAESLRIELRRILDPDVVVLTNIRADHTIDLPDPERAFARAMPLEAKVICPSDIPERFRQQLESIRRRTGALMLIPADERDNQSPSTYVEWPENIALAKAACKQVAGQLDWSPATLDDAHPDVGAFRAWRFATRGGDVVLVNGFAANDPESTRMLLMTAKTRWSPERCVGLLNLRRDRGDRTLQWIRELSRGRLTFDRLVLMGDVPLLSVRPLRRLYGDRLSILRARRPEMILSAMVSGTPAGSMVFGFGNIGGPGLGLVELWQKEGRPT